MIFVTSSPQTAAGAPSDPIRPAPVAVFAYKRADHLRRSLDSLAANPLASQTDLSLFCDGPRQPADAAAVAEVREVAGSVRGFANVSTVFRPFNFGLAKSIIAGTSEVLERHGRVIVVEDDLLVSPHFLSYMNDGLERYADAEEVASIHAYCLPIDAGLPETFFLRGADCWGWATWSRAWKDFEADGAALLGRLRERRLEHAFDLDGSYPFTRMLEDQVAKRNDSWAIRWHASTFLKNRLTLHPGASLVTNIGLDSSGEHCGTTPSLSGLLTDAPVRVGGAPLQESHIAREAFKAFHRRDRGLASRVRSVALRVLGR